MARAAKPSTPTPIDPKRIGGIKRLRHLLPLLAPLRDVGCERDTAGNRQLHFDEYVTLVLLCLTNPLIDSVRALQQASELDKVREQLGVGRFSLGSFSESVRCFDPERLRQVISQLAGEMRPVNADPRLRTHLDQALVMADGTVLDAIATVAQAAWRPNGGRDNTVKHAWKLHVQFDFDAFLPDADAVALTDARNSGTSDEKYVLRTRLKRDCCYVTDRWFAQFTLFNDIRAAGSSYVCRAKENSVFDVVEERLLSDDALKAGIVRDAVVRMGLNSKPGERPDHPVRLIVIEARPHAKRTRAAGPGNKGTIVIATSLLHVPAEIIALIYQHRWAIEVFFRFFKQILGCKHLLSQRREGVLVQVYCAIIACMLINLWTGRKPTKRTVEMLAWYFVGVASDDEMLAHIAGLQKTNG